MEESRSCVAHHPFRRALMAVALLTVFLLRAGIAETVAQQQRNDETALRAPIDDWRDTLSFGIDSEVTALLETLVEQRESRLHREIVERYADSFSPWLRQRILEFFTEMEYPGLEPQALEILREPREHSNDLVLAAVRYVAAAVAQPSAETLSALHSLTQAQQTMIAETAIRTIGRRGGHDDINSLLSRLHDRSTSTALRGAIILALGELGATEAVDDLIRISSNSAEESVARQYAADSLGRIGDERAIAALAALVTDEDTMLRAYAVNGIGHFAGREVERVLIGALRDSFWRVRVAALQGIARQNVTGAVAAVIYRAERDPETQVRNEAFATLAQLDDRRSREFLSEFVLNQRNTEALRISALQRMLQYAITSHVDVIEKLIEAEYDETQSRILDQIGRLLSTSQDRVPNRVYDRLLRHPNFLIQIYGVRAVGLHGVTALRGRISEMTEEPFPQAVRRTALDALQRM